MLNCNVYMENSFHLNLKLWAKKSIAMILSVIEMLGQENLYKFLPVPGLAN